MTVGIIGGGQLAKMMIESSPEHKYVVIEPTENCPVKNMATILQSNYDDKDALEKLHKLCDVITYEFENVPSSALTSISDKLLPNKEVLFISQNRLKEKEIARNLGFKTPNFWKIESKDDLRVMRDDPPSNYVLKTTEGGYDGKGQMVIKNGNFDEAIEWVIDGREYILEQFIDFDYETSIIAHRDIFGNIVYQPSTRNIHENNILRKTINTEYIDNTKMKEYSRLLLEKLDVVGTLTIEFFVKGDEYIFNEIAPRVHNSGHWTIDGTTVSQFRNHMLAVTKQKVVKPVQKDYTTMINILGEEFYKLRDIEKTSKLKIYDYNKAEVRPNRKMAHINISSNSKEELNDMVSHVEKEL